MIKQIITGLMILLVLPIALADSLSIEARGSDDVLNFIRGVDTIIFKATASITGDADITPNQILLGTNLQFDSCGASISGVDCFLRFPASGTQTFEAVAMPYTITLKNDLGAIAVRQSGVLFIDSLPPVVRSFSVSQGDDIRFNFNVRDESCTSASCAGKCSGIQRVRLFSLDSSFEEIIVLDSDSCDLSDSVNLAKSRFPDGENTVFLEAVDRFDQVSLPRSVSLEIDKTPPLIDINTFKVVDSTDLDIGFFGPNPIPVVVKQFFLNYYFLICDWV